MKAVNLLNFEDEFEVLEKKVQKFEEQGYEYFRGDDSEDSFSEAVRIKLPSGEYLSRAKIQRRLRKLIFGNSHQIESMKALEYLTLKEISEGYRD